MRKAPNSMMNAVAARPEDFAAACLRLAQAAVPALAPAVEDSPPALPLPLARWMAFSRMTEHLAHRQGTQLGQAGALWPTAAWDGQLMQEATAMGQAAASQWLTLQAQWLEGLQDLAREAGEIHHVNTVSKYVDHEANLVQQSMMLVSAQATAAARLAENIQVNLAWWMNQKLQPPA